MKKMIKKKLQVDNKLTREHVLKQMQEMYNLCPFDVINDKNYVFLVSKSFENVPEYFNKMRVYSSNVVPKDTMYIMFNPFFDEED
jgi:hypothetical protein